MNSEAMASAGFMAAHGAHVGQAVGDSSRRATSISVSTSEACATNENSATSGAFPSANGTRNVNLNSASFSVGQLVEGGEIDCVALEVPLVKPADELLECIGRAGRGESVGGPH